MMAIESYFAFIIIVVGTLLYAREISEEEKEKFINDMLKEHNEWRKKHGSEQLELDEKLCKDAQKYVDEWSAPRPLNCYELRITRIPDKFGYNAFSKEVSDNYVLDANLAVQSWYDFKKYYDYENELVTYEPKLPFTKVVWKSTKQLGVGVSLNDDVFRVLAFYSPPGNQPRQYKENVDPPQNDAKEE